MIELTYEEVLNINAEIVAFTNEPFCILNESNIKSAIGNQYQPYDTDEQRIASVYKSLAINHGFQNGNKRTAVTCLYAFDIPIKCSDVTLYNLTYQLASEGGSKISVNKIANILFNLNLEEQLILIKNYLTEKYPGQTNLRKVLENIASLICDEYDPSKTYAIHHLNGDHNDNRLENIALMDSKRHNSYHSSLA